VNSSFSIKINLIYMNKLKSFIAIFTSFIAVLITDSKAQTKISNSGEPRALLTSTGKVYFNSFVDCNMAEAWIGDTFRIFPGKYGEDPLWGNARDLKFADGNNADEAFSSTSGAFVEPLMPPNAAPGTKGLHGAVWFETVSQDRRDTTGKTLFAIYHNENYPATLPFDSSTGEGYLNVNWPQGLTGASTPAAVCRIGVMKSVDGGRSWTNKGIFIEDHQERMILKPHNNSITFAGGVGDPSAVASGNYLYLFYGEYGYPGVYNAASYSADKEWSGQCISIARILLTDLDDPAGKAKRWNGVAFDAAFDGVGSPVPSLQIPHSAGGGPASKAGEKFYWGPSVSWNTYLNAWVMLMAKAEGPSWQGSSIYISFNKNANLGNGKNSQEWTTPRLLVNKPGHILWYPSLQPLNSTFDNSNKNTCLKLGRQARLFFKDMYDDKSEYCSEYLVDFKNSDEK
jgi:hypothetical protein